MIKGLGNKPPSPPETLPMSPVQFIHRPTYFISASQSKHIKCAHIKSSKKNSGAMARRRAAFPQNFPQQFSCVVNKTHRRPTLLTTLATVVAPWLDVRCNTPTARIVYYTSVDRNTQTIARSCVCDRCVSSYNTCNFRQPKKFAVGENDARSVCTS